MSSDQEPHVLLVDDDPQILQVYCGFLEGAYELDTATSGETALDAITEVTDVVLLDRRMPGMTGDEVAEAIRQHGYDCRVAMVTALPPEVDIVDMGIDDYLVKPVTASKLRNVVDSLLRWGDYDAALREYYELARKAAVLEEENSQEALESKVEYQQLKERLSTLQEKSGELIDGADDDVLKEIIGQTADAENQSTDAEPAGSLSK